ncbi:hypothetical protein STREPTOSP366_59410 [Streptomyces variabilis]
MTVSERTSVHAAHGDRVLPGSPSRSVATRAGEDV